MACTYPDFPCDTGKVIHANFTGGTRSIAARRDESNAGARAGGNSPTAGV